MILSFIADGYLLSYTQSWSRSFCGFAGLAGAPGLEGLQCAHKWLADLLVHFSKDVTAYSAVRLVMPES